MCRGTFDYEYQTMYALRTLCKEFNIKKYSKFNKQKLRDYIVKIIIERNFKGFLRTYNDSLQNYTFLTILSNNNIDDTNLYEYESYIYNPCFEILNKSFDTVVFFPVKIKKYILNNMIYEVLKSTEKYIFIDPPRGLRVYINWDNFKQNPCNYIVEMVSFVFSVINFLENFINSCIVYFTISKQSIEKIKEIILKKKIIQYLRFSCICELLSRDIKELHLNKRHFSNLYTNKFCSLITMIEYIFFLFYYY